MTSSRAMRFKTSVAGLSTASVLSSEPRLDPGETFAKSLEDGPHGLRPRSIGQFAGIVALVE